MSAFDEEDDALISRLANCGCIIPEGARRLADIPHENILGIAQKCIDTIAREEDTPVPSGKGDRVLAASKIATACKDLGYDGELGYDLFIYPNEPDLRTVLSFLMAKISDAERRGSSETADFVASLMRKVAVKLEEESNEPWLPSYCTPRCYGVDDEGVWVKNRCGRVEPFLSKPFIVPKDCKNITSAFNDYWKNSMSNCDTVEPERNFRDSLRADIILNKLKSKNEFNGEQKIHMKDKTEDETCLRPVLKKSETPKINEINIQSLNLKTLYDNDGKNIVIQSLLMNDNNVDQIMMLQERLLTGIAQLQNKIKGAVEKVKQEEPFTEDHEQSIELTKLEDKIKMKTNKLKKIKKNRVYLSISPDKERIIYANDVNETIDHLIKLKVDMSKIISNINTTQKEINRINGVLDRSFAVADELIFKDAKKDEFARKTYKLIANVHTECNELCNMVEEIGVYARETVAIEKNVETAQQKNTKENLKRAIEDLRNLSIK